MVPFRSSFLRYWRGEYSLAVSFWLVGVAGLALVLAALALYTIVISQLDFHPLQAMAVVAPVWAISGVFALYQLIGVWRSAVRSRSVPPLFVWAAQTLSMGGVGVFLFLLWNVGLPRLQESVGIAFRNDPQVPGYSLRLMRDATELEIAGGFKYGLAHDVEALLNANPRVRLIHLNSSGGRLGEGQKLAELIRARRLSTYTATECSSACTVAFAAGRERWIRKGAVLGYHAASFGGTDSSATMRKALIDVGVNKAFAARAAQTSSGNIWYPKPNDLTDNGIITASADTYKFAASGRGTPEKLNDGLKELLLTVPAFRAMDEVAPFELVGAADHAQQVYASGASEGELMDTIKRTHLVPFLKMRLATASNDTLMEFAESLADQLDSLSHSDEEECFDYAVHGATEAIYDDLPYELTEREDELLKKIMQSSGTAPKRTAYAKDFEFPREVVPADHGRYCRRMVSLLREVSEMPPPRAAAITRDIVTKLYSR